MRPRRCRRGWRRHTPQAHPDARSFNEAAALSPRMVVGERSVPPVGRHASMRPRRCRRGWPVGVRIHRPDSRASMRPRRCRRGWVVGRQERALPAHASMRPRRCRRGWWGVGPGDGALHVASMRPRRCRRGWRRSDGPRAPLPARFNEAAALSPRMGSTRTSRATTPSFNEAAALSPRMAHRRR